MLKIFDAAQVRRIDGDTVAQEGISSLDLMERAAKALYERLFPVMEVKQPVFVFAGQGNNGGDALALARMLQLSKIRTETFLVMPDNKLSSDCRANKERLEKTGRLHIIRSEKDIPDIPPQSIVIDGLFGSGLNRPAEGVYKAVIQTVNQACGTVYSIDIPSGMYMDNNEDNDPETIIKADCTFSFQFPKLALLLPESGIYCKHFSILDIGLSPLSIEKEETCYYLADKTDIQPLIVPRGKFAHKGNFGRAFIVAGSHGKMGAAVLAARACLRTGVGLLTMRVPDCGIDVMQASVPEAMAHVGEYGRFAADTENHAVGIGPGIGMSDEMKTLLQDLYSRCKPMVIDADALNLTAACEDLKAALPANSILTPHPAEFDRLFGSPSPNGYRRLQSARHFAQKHRVYIVLKGAYTAIITPESAVYFNPSGNPGMATGGSGDVLTGILTSLLAQGCQPLQACLLGVYLHGLAGDIAAERQSQHAMLPSDLIDCLGRAYKAIQTEDQ